MTYSTESSRIRQVDSFHQKGAGFVRVASRRPAYPPSDTPVPSRPVPVHQGVLFLYITLWFFYEWIFSKQAAILHAAFPPPLEFLRVSWQHRSVFLHLMTHKACRIDRAKPWVTGNKDGAKSALWLIPVIVSWADKRTSVKVSQSLFVCWCQDLVECLADFCQLFLEAHVLRFGKEMKRKKRRLIPKRGGWSWQGCLG